MSYEYTRKCPTSPQLIAVVGARPAADAATCVRSLQILAQGATASPTVS